MGFQYPEFFSCASTNDAMPVNDFLGEMQLEEKDGGVLVKYEGSFAPKGSEADPALLEMFKAAQKSAF